MSYFEVKKLPPITTPTITGATCTFDSVYGGLPLASHTVLVDVSQPGSGIPTPQAPRPIIIYDELTITHNLNNYVIDFGGYFAGTYNAITGGLQASYYRLDIKDLVLDDFTVTTYNAQARFYLPYTAKTVPDVQYPTYSNWLGYSSETFMGSSYWADQRMWNTLGQYEDIISFDNNGTYGRIRTNQLSDTATLQDLKDYFTNAYLVYELATPLSIQLAPCRVLTAEDVNVVSGNTGDTTLQYSKFG